MLVNEAAASQVKLFPSGLLPHSAISGKSFAEKLADELIDGSNKQGSAYRKREEAHRMAEANRAFSHYRV